MPDTAVTTDARPVPSPLRPLRRLRQLTEEMQDALRRGDVSLVKQASDLLAPALTQWAEARVDVDLQDAQVLQLTAETQQALGVCETSVTQAMMQVKERDNALRQRLRRVRQIRARKTPVSTGRALNLSR